MDIRVLQYFLVVAREENITRAAGLLHITQPTLSRQLMQLEEELGTKLLVRSNHNVTLTEEGFLFRRRAQELVELAARAKSELVGGGEVLAGRIAIGCGETRAVKELAERIAAFQRRHPLVKFELYSGSNEDIQERMERGTLDMGLFLEPFHAARYAYIRMQTKEQWGVLLHREHPLAGARCIRPGDLVGTRVVTVHIDTPVHATLAEWSGEYAKEMDFCANYNVLHNGVVLAREQKGVVICLKPDCQYADMEYLPFEPPLEFGSVLAWKDGMAKARAVRVFLQFVRPA